MSDTFQSILGAKGFTLLTWGDVGFNYLFTQTPVQKPADIRKTTPWVWDTDPITKAVMKVLNINAVSLGVPDVLPSLQTGVINAFLNSPYGAVALQWYTQAKYVTNLRLAVVIGGVVISNKSLEKLSAEQEKIVKETFAAEGKELLAQIRKDNEQAIGTITKSGIKSVPATNMDAWLDMAKKTREQLSGTLFPDELVAEMLKHLEAAR
jgi:TRAP-type C4-dicarboxylate transport system substrate-binding protein